MLCFLKKSILHSVIINSLLKKSRSLQLLGALEELEFRRIKR